MKKIISIFTLQNVMKVSVCVFILLFALSTSFSSCANNSGKVNDSTLVENQDSIVIEEVENPIKEEPVVKGVELSWSYDVEYWGVFKKMFFLYLDYENGNAKMTCRWKEKGGDHRSQTFNYEGSWKSISVKRGRNYIEAYDIQLEGISWTGDEILNAGERRKLNNKMELYTTEKFDCIFDNWDDFYGGVSGGIIDNVKYVTE